MNLTKPCQHCPFRTDIPGFLTRKRVEEIWGSITDGQQTFSCHHTTEFADDEDGEEYYVKSPEEEHCAGALILLEKLKLPNQWMRWMERLHFYDHTKLDMDSPVFDSFEDMVEAQPQ